MKKIERKYNVGQHQKNHSLHCGRCKECEFTEIMKQTYNL